MMSASNFFSLIRMQTEAQTRAADEDTPVDVHVLTRSFYSIANVGGEIQNKANLSKTKKDEHQSDDDF